MDNLIKLIGRIPVQLELFERVVWECTVGQELPFPQIRDKIIRHYEEAVIMEFGDNYPAWE